MNSESPTIHVHLGVDNLFEDTFKRLLSPSLQQDGKPQIDYVPDAFYKQHYRAAVDGGHIVLRADELANAGFETNILALSRPRFFYTGSPMNTQAGATSSLYKLDGLQEAFSNYRLVFHLFITDHLTYLFGLGIRSVILQPNSAVSWMPLVDAVRTKIRDQNELRVHDAENAKIFHRRLMAELLGLSEPSLSSIYDQHFLTSEPDSRSIEAIAENVGWDIDKLDYQYIKDIDHLSSM